MNKSTLSAIVCVTLVAVIAACRPAATPMAIPTDTPTLVPSTATPLPTPTATPSPTLAPTSTPLPTVTPVPPTPSLTPVPTSTPLPTVTPVPPTPTPTSLPPTLTPTMVPTTPEVEGEYIRILAVNVTGRVPAGEVFPVIIRYAWSFRDKGDVRIGTEGFWGWRSIAGVMPIGVTGKGEFTHGLPSKALDTPGLHTFTVSAYGCSAGSYEPNLIDRREVTVTVLPSGAEAEIDSETAKALMPSAEELGVEHLWYWEFTLPDEGEGFGDLPIFQAYNQLENTTTVDLMVFADADDAERFTNQVFSDYESKGYMPVWTDLGDESFSCTGEVMARVERYILWAVAEVAPHQLRPSVQRLQAFVGGAIPATPTLEPCHITPTHGFGKVWDENPSMRAYVGCPYGYSHEKGMDFIAQRFEHGVIFWAGGPDYDGLSDAYVLFRDDGTFIQARVSVSWSREQPAPMPTPTATPTEPFEPQGNLAEVWREGPGVKRRLGLAVEPEKSGNGAWQEFLRGWMFWIPYEQGTPDDALGKPFEQRDRWIYVLADYWPYPPGGERNEWLEFLDTWEE